MVLPMIPTLSTSSPIPTASSSSYSQPPVPPLIESDNKSNGGGNVGMMDVEPIPVAEYVGKGKGRTEDPPMSLSVSKLDKLWRAAEAAQAEAEMLARAIAAEEELESEVQEHVQREAATVLQEAKARTQRDAALNREAETVAEEKMCMAVVMVMADAERKFLSPHADWGVVHSLLVTACENLVKDLSKQVSLQRHQLCQGDYRGVCSQWQFIA